MRVRATLEPQDDRVQRLPRRPFDQRRRAVGERDFDVEHGLENLLGIAARLTELKKTSRYVIVNADSTAAHGLWQRVINAIAEAGCDPVSGTRVEGE